MSTFINPYNFVRPGKPLDEKSHYVSLKKFSGFSGVIVCTLTALTPIFVPDPNKTIKIGEKREMKFFRLNYNRLAIPATSLKGMIRSVAEAASNSCFSVFDDTLILYRDIDPIIEEEGIIYQDGDGTWFIQKVEEIIITNQRELDNYKDGDEVCFQFGGVDKRGDKIRRKAININGTEFDERGILKEYYKGISKSKFIRIGFRIVIKSKEEPYEVPEDAIKTYQKTIKHPDLASEEISKKTQAYLENINNSFVYFTVDSESKINSFGKNFRYKWLKENSTAKLLERDNPDLLPCTSRDELCICCRMFGTIGNKEKNQEALAGRISFTDAIVEGNPKMIPDVKLRILGQPRPKYYPFYLIGQNEAIRPIKRYDDEDSLLRGRKFYWHHLQDSKYYMDNRSPQGEWDKQNAKVELVPKDTKFSFKVEFENLTETELGLLLYSLELENNMAHKIGMGKPIGLGSAKIKITNCKIEDLTSRYGKTGKTPFSKDNCINEFKKQLSISNSDQRFQEIPNIRDLMIMLYIGKLPSKAAYPPVPSGYPPEQGFRWFTKDKKQSPMPTPTDIQNNENMLKEH